MSEDKKNDMNVNVLDREPVIKKTEKYKKLRMWKVLFLSDDFTTFEFVVEMLKKHFRHSEESANSLTQEIHSKGTAVAGVYTFEVSETKAYEVMQDAKAKEFPLQVVLQPDKNSEE